MEFSSLIGHTAELLRIILKSPNPADKITKEYLRAKKYLGSNDRKFISEVLYFLLRIKSLPESQVIKHQKQEKYAVFNPQNDNIYEFLLVLSGIISADLMGITLKSISEVKYKYQTFKQNDSLIDFLAESGIRRFDIDKSDFNEILKSIQTSIRDLIHKTETLEIKAPLTDDDLDCIALRYAQQPWIIRSLIESGNYTNDELKNLLESFFYQAPITLRINQNPEKRDSIIDKLREYDPGCKETLFSPFGITLSKRIDLNTVQLYKSGIIDIQDEGSQLITIALEPKRDEFILDACAGAGGKSIHIAAITGNTCSITASDIELKKLKELNKRASKSGFSNITTFLAKNIPGSEYDRVLVDAPCSGMGTIRRNAMLKWKLTPKLLEKYNRKQYQILEKYSKFVKPGGILLYSTCSIMPQENEHIITKFLDKNSGFIPEPLSPSFDIYGIDLPNLNAADFQYQLLPNIHHCDGFYFAKLKRLD